MHATFVNEFHQIELIDDWDEAEIENTHWGLAFVDQRPAERRMVDVKRLVNNADYIVRPNYAHMTVLSNLQRFSKLKQPYE